MAVYDDQQTRPESKELDDLNQLTGISPAEEQSMEDRAITDDMAERNQLDNKTEDNDKKSPDSGDGDEIPYNADDGKRRRGFRLTKKQGITGGIVGLLVGGGFGIFGILSGPAQIIHFSQLLQQFHFVNNDEFANGRTNRYLYHRVRNTGSNGPGYARMRTRLGVIGNRIADTMEIKMQKEHGLRSLYDTRTGNLVGYEMVSSDRAINAIMSAGTNPDLDWQILASNEIPSGVSVTGADGRPINGNNRVLIARPNESQSITDKMREIGRRRGFQRNLTKSLGLNKVASTVAFRKTAARGRLDLTPWRRLGQTVRQNKIEAIRQRWKSEAKNGVTAPNDLSLGNTDAEGNEISSEDSEARRQAEAEARQTQGEIRDSARNGSLEVEKSKMSGKIAGAGLGIGTLCAARSISNNIGQVRQANIIMPLMRVGTRVIAMGSQVMTGQGITMEELSVTGKMLHDNELGSWAGARSIQAEQGLPTTGRDIPATAKPSRVNEKPVFLSVIDSIFDSIPGVGSAACSQVGQFVLGAVTGGAIRTAVEEVVMGLASAAGVNPIDAFASWLVNVLAGEEVDVDAVGSDLGNIANYGARLAANEQALSMGGVALSPRQVAELDSINRIQMEADFKSQNFFARTLDLNQANSLLSKALLGNDTLVALYNRPSSIISALFGALPNLGGVLNLMTPQISAQSSYDYGFDEYGFSLRDQEDPRVDDPYENAEIVEQNIDFLASEYGDCFSTKINPETFAIEGSEPMDYSKLEDNASKCSNSNDEGLLRYRFYIADTMIAKSLSCYEGIDDSSCTELGFGGQLTADTPQSAQPSTAVVGSTSETPCAPGTNDMGTETGYSGGNAYSIRLCAIPGFISSNEEGNGNLVRVNSTVSGNWLELYRKSQEQGINLNARGSFRSMERQEYFWGCYQSKRCNGGNQAARPGWSNHQMGFSVDIAMDASGLSVANCEARRSSYPIYRFLAENAPPLGIQADVSSECWHWTSK